MSNLSNFITDYVQYIIAWSTGILILLSVCGKQSNDTIKIEHANKCFAPFPLSYPEICPSLLACHEMDFI